MSGSAGIMASIANALSAISPASITVISRVPGRSTPSWARDSNIGARLLADPTGPCNSGSDPRRSHARLPMRRRTFLKASSSAALAAGAASLVGLTSSRATATEYARVKLPPAISREERLQRLAKARALMERQGIGAILIEAGPSLDYFTGVQWWRSERLTAAVIPAQGDPIIVTPFFEKPSVSESLGIPAEVRSWNEDEEPLRLVEDFLRERGVAAAPLGFEETNRYFILDRLRQQLPALRE